MLLPLPLNDVHTWVVRLDELDVHMMRRVLSPDERARAARYRFETPRREYVNTRGALRSLLNAYTGVPADALRFTYGAQGKPTLAGNVHFNVSHAGGLALIAIAKIPIGVDIEPLANGSNWELIANQFLSMAERSAIRKRSHSERPGAFLRLWTRREAYVKAHGTGLAGSEDLCCSNDFIVDAHGCSWTVTSIIPHKDYVAAVSAKAEHIRICLNDWKSAT